ncbi:hypothetical protein GCM10022220_52860 [Actinocatenispora rupis]
MVVDGGYAAAGESAFVEGGEEGGGAPFVGDDDGDAGGAAHAYDLAGSGEDAGDVGGAGFGEYGGEQGRLGG